MPVVHPIAPSPFPNFTGTAHSTLPAVQAIENAMFDSVSEIAVPSTIAIAAAETTSTAIAQTVPTMTMTMPTTTLTTLPSPTAVTAPFPPPSPGATNSFMLTNMGTGIGMAGLAGAATASALAWTTRECTQSTYWYDEDCDGQLDRGVMVAWICFIVTMGLVALYLRRDNSAITDTAPASRTCWWCSIMQMWIRGLRENGARSGTEQTMTELRECAAGGNAGDQGQREVMETLVLTVEEDEGESEVTAVEEEEGSEQDVAGEGAAHRWDLDCSQCGGGEDCSC